MKKKVDLIDQDPSSVRNLEQKDDLANFPIPLCYFNLTDNNVITSISCHKDLSEEKINSIVLDLYFFRPPGVSRLDKENENITITTRKEGLNYVIRETNGGMCNINNAFNSICTTDINTTKDREGNLISYSELATTNLTTNENNYFIKKKYTNLSDITKFVEKEKLNPEKYNKTLNILYAELKKYMKEYVQFSLNDFKEFYFISKGIEDETKLRNLEEKNTTLNSESEEEIFRYNHFAGVKLVVSLKNNLGYGSENLYASSDLLIDEEKNNLAKSL